MKRTALHALHLEHGGRMIDFAGWEMPLQYQSTIKEHLSVRGGAGVFDCSHMGEVFVRGGKAHGFIDHLITNNFASLGVGKAVYSPMLYPEGTFVDDIIAYKLEDGALLVVNASNIEKDVDWIREQAEGNGDYRDGVVVEDRSEEYSLLALQGPKVSGILEAIFPSRYSDLKPFEFDTLLPPFGNGLEGPSLVSRTGYTGEDGVECIVPNEFASDLFNRFLKEGAAPCGLGSRDSLRLEKGYSLYGHEITNETNAIEAGLSWTIDFSKRDFVGKQALEAIRKRGLDRILRGFVVQDRGIPRQGDVIFGDGEELGFVTSGAYSPLLKKSIGLGYVDKAYSGLEFRIGSRQKEGAVMRALRHKRSFV